jgi:hypothetical protein
MPLVVERSFEAASDVMAGAVSHRRHRLGRSQAPAPGTANEEEVVVPLHSKRPEFTGKVLSKARVHGLIRKGLPFDEDGAFAYGSEIRDPDIRPFCTRADIDQLRIGTGGKALPSRLDIDSVDWFIVALQAQITSPQVMMTFYPLLLLFRPKSTGPGSKRWLREKDRLKRRKHGCLQCNKVFCSAMRSLQRPAPSIELRGTSYRLR